MPRPKKPGAPEPKRRSRNGCWPCKGRKIKCGEEHPACVNCQRIGESCDYSIRLNWEGRRTKRSDSGLGENGILQLSPTQASPTQSSPRQPLQLVSHSFALGDSDPAALPSVRRPEYEGVFGPVSLTSRGLLPLAISSPPYETLPSPGAASQDNGKRRLGPDEAEQHIGMMTAGRQQQQQLARATNGVGEYETVIVMSPVRSTTLSQSPLSSQSPRRHSVQTVSSFQRPHKRARSDQFDVDGMARPQSQPQQQHAQPHLSPSSLNGSSPPLSRFQSISGPSGPVAMSLGSPVTPAASSPYSDGPDLRTATRPHAPPNSPEFRRLTVRSLLASSPGPAFHESNWVSPLPMTPTDGPSPDYNFYGYDVGQKDEDLGKNDDAQAIAKVPPAVPEEVQMRLNGHLRRDSLPAEFGFGVLSNGSNHRGGGGYYDKPVPILIPKDLWPLPQKLRENPMNLLYFHHFLDHTARVLVPYDDPQSNPFRIILPRMAVGNDNLLSLLLAYSASHRARTLKQSEPAMRIALWVEDIFPALRKALNDQQKSVSNANLATAIMLASLEIISPTAFGFDIPWQKHLNLARDLMKKRLSDLTKLRSSSSEDQVCSFLWSWFAYLDVLGSLSGGPSGDPPADSSDDNDDDDDIGSLSGPAKLFAAGINNADEDQNEIDCIMGFTNRCVRLLARIAELARRCDAQRIERVASFPPSSTYSPAHGQRQPQHRIRQFWTPTPKIAERALGLIHSLMDSLQQETRPCRHLHTETIDADGRAEMKATNEAFHWAGLVHLHRRVLGKASEHPDVQGPVQKIIQCMGRIRRGGTAETGFLFPMFTAGCDTSDEAQRIVILERFQSVENSGMTQVNRARRLMQKVWETGQPFETLLSTEFIG